MSGDRGASFDDTQRVERFDRLFQDVAMKTLIGATKDILAEFVVDVFFRNVRDRFVDKQTLQQRLHTNAHTMNNGQILNYILNINTLVDTSNLNGQRLFYALCTTFVRKSIAAKSALDNLTHAFDRIIEIEHRLFNRRRILGHVLAYLADHSDGDNLQCRINLQCLDYLMKRYID
ncbi:hypothetical protein [Alphabaculovirus myunipunctae]|uniref:Uncharacterized protein n=1 Tax=Mythimna unipuncta nucleopolyhedrovirus TaxID=447897 RepID=A0A2K9VS86_9ABAC|nr:hypothetical protein [Mythimna unipuncta nucleopolyhedrovirus]AUV65313.1 hypothetical protein [Mythimna unipuncta nucleopolyhedrovirus]